MAIGTIVGQFVMFISLYFLIEVANRVAILQVDRSSLSCLLKRQKSRQNKQANLDNRKKRLDDGNKTSRCKHSL